MLKSARGISRELTEVMGSELNEGMPGLVTSVRYCGGAGDRSRGCGEIDRIDRGWDRDR